MKLRYLVSSFLLVLAARGEVSIYVPDAVDAPPETPTLAQVATAGSTFTNGSAAQYTFYRVAATFPAEPTYGVFSWGFRFLTTAPTPTTNFLMSSANSFWRIRAVDGNTSTAHQIFDEGNFVNGANYLSPFGSGANLTDIPLEVPSDGLDGLYMRTHGSWVRVYTNMVMGNGLYESTGSNGTWWSVAPYTVTNWMLFPTPAAP